MDKKLLSLLELLWWMLLLFLNIKSIISVKNEWILSLSILAGIICVIQLFKITFKN